MGKRTGVQETLKVTGHLLRRPEVLTVTRDARQLSPAAERDDRRRGHRNDHLIVGNGQGEGI
jgi:beta-lactamase class A